MGSIVIVVAAVRGGLLCIPFGYLAKDPSSCHGRLLLAFVCLQRTPGRAGRCARLAVGNAVESFELDLKPNAVITTSRLSDQYSALSAHERWNTQQVQCCRFPRTDLVEAHFSCGVTWRVPSQVPCHTG